MFTAVTGGERGIYQGSEEGGGVVVGVRPCDCLCGSAVTVLFCSL